MSPGKGRFYFVTGLWSTTGRRSVSSFVMRDAHPFEWLMEKGKNRAILFYAEISQEEYELVAEPRKSK
jgi:hypothetical protein